VVVKSLSQLPALTTPWLGGRARGLAAFGVKFNSAARSGPRGCPVLGLDRPTSKPSPEARVREAAHRALTSICHPGLVLLVCRSWGRRVYGCAHARASEAPPHPRAGTRCEGPPGASETVVPSPGVQAAEGTGGWW